MCIQCISLSLHKHESIICAPLRQVGRYYFILQMAIKKWEIKCPSYAYRETLCQSQYLNAPCLHAAPQGLIAFEAVQLQALWPQAILGASSKTSSVQNKHRWEGDSAEALVWATSTKQTWEMTEYVSLWTTRIKCHHLSKYNIYVRAASPFETLGLIWNRVEPTWKTRLYLNIYFLKWTLALYVYSYQTLS